MRSLRQITITLLATLVAAPVFTGIQLLFFSLSGYVHMSCVRYALSGKCVSSEYDYPPVNHSLLVMGLILLFLSGLLFSAITTRFTSTIASGIIACGVAACLSARYAHNMYVSTQKGLDYGYFAIEYVTNVFLNTYGEIGTVILMLIASLLGGRWGKRQGTVIAPMSTLHHSPAS